MADSYFIKRGEKVSGPFSAGQVKKLAQDGKFRDDDGVSNRQDGPWTPAAKAFKKQGEESHQQSVTPEPETPATEPSAAPRTRQCEDCGGTVSLRAQACPHCGSPLTAESASGSQLAEQSEPATPASSRSRSEWSIEQLDTMAFVVEGAAYDDVFACIRDAISQEHTLSDAFKRSGKIRGEGDSGIQFIVHVNKTEEGVEFGIDGETPDGPVNFEAWFDPTEASGWALAAGTGLFNTIVNSNAQDSVKRDFMSLVINILDALGATHVVDEILEREHKQTEAEAKRVDETVEAIGKGVTRTYNVVRFGLLAIVTGLLLFALSLALGWHMVEEMDMPVIGSLVGFGGFLCAYVVAKAIARYGIKK